MNKILVSFFKVPLSVEYYKLEPLKTKDSLLKKAISDYAKELMELEKEVWKIEDNILVAEDGYYLVFEQTDEIKDFKK